MPQDPKQPEPEPKVDITKRYDLYWTRYPQGMHVYRNVLFKGTRTLFSTGQFDVMSQFLELEHPNGERVFISRHGIAGFCEHGKQLGTEIIHER